MTVTVVGTETLAVVGSEADQKRVGGNADVVERRDDELPRANVLRPPRDEPPIVLQQSPYVQKRSHSAQHTTHA